MTKVVEVGEDGAMFDVRIDHRLWNVIASNGGGWDHVSIVPLHHKRMPDWSIMCQLKDLCFNDDETAIEYHPKKPIMSICTKSACIYGDHRKIIYQCRLKSLFNER